MTTQTPAVVAAHIDTTQRAVSAVTVSLDAAVSALTIGDAVAAEDAIRTAKAKMTAAAVAARRLTATVHRVKAERPGKTAAEAQIRRGDPEGVVAELFVMTANWQDWPTKMHVPAHSPWAMDAVRLCWPAIRRKYNLPADATIPVGCAVALRKAWDAHTAEHGHSGSCYIADAYANTRGLRAALHR